MMLPYPTKTILSILLLFSLFEISSCGRDNDDSSSPPTTTQTPQEEESGTDPDPEQLPDPDPPPTQGSTNVRMICYSQEQNPDGTTSFYQSYMIKIDRRNSSYYSCHDRGCDGITHCIRKGKLKKVVYEDPKMYCLVKKKDSSRFSICTGEATEVINSPHGHLAELSVFENTNVTYKVFCQKKILDYLVR